MNGQITFIRDGKSLSSLEKRPCGFSVFIVWDDAIPQFVDSQVQCDVMIAVATDDNSCFDAANISISAAEWSKATTYAMISPDRCQIRRNGAWHEMNPVRDPNEMTMTLLAVDVAIDMLIAQGVTNVLICGDHGAVVADLPVTDRMALTGRLTGRGRDILSPHFSVEANPGASSLLHDWLQTATRRSFIIKESALGSISIPCTKHDLKNLARLFRLWCDPRFSPSVRQPRIRPVLLILLNSPTDRKTENAVHAVIAEHTELTEIFAEIIVEFANLTGDRDIYVRSGQNIPAPLGQKAGPNYLFFETMARAARFGGFTFLNEVDCMPLMPGWLDVLEQTAAARPHRWVIGASYLGNATMRTEFSRQINGNALYQVGSQDFQRFISQVWKPRLEDRIKSYPMLAYDCWWSLETSIADVRDQNSEWFLTQAYDSVFEAAPFLLNAAHVGDTMAVTYDRYRHLARVSAAPVMLHGIPVDALIEAVMTDRSTSPLAALREAAMAEEHIYLTRADAPNRRLFRDIGTTMNTALNSAPRDTGPVSCTIVLDDAFKDPAFYELEKMPDGRAFRWMGQADYSAIPARIAHNGNIEIAVHIPDSITDAMVDGLHIGCNGQFEQSSTLTKENGLIVKKTRISLLEDATDSVMVNLLIDDKKNMAATGDTRDLAVAVHKIVLTAVAS